MMNNLRRFRAGLLLLVLGCLPLNAMAETPYGVGVEAGTTGLGLQLHAGMSETLNLRLGLSHISASESVNADDNNGVRNDELRYDGELDLTNLSLIGDWYPWAGNFHVSLGGVLNNNDLEVEARCTNPSGCEIGSNNFSRSQIGTITTDIDFKEFGPYLGIGWGNPVAGDTGWHWRFELGAIYVGEPSVSMDSTSDCGLFQSVCNRELKEEERELEDDLSDLKWYPVATLGLSYRF